jgi:hypothetical protein
MPFFPANLSEREARGEFTSDGHSISSGATMPRDHLRSLFEDHGCEKIVLVPDDAVMLSSRRDTSSKKLTTRTNITTTKEAQQYLDNFPTHIILSPVLSVVPSDSTNND